MSLSVRRMAMWNTKINITLKFIWRMREHSSPKLMNSDLSLSIICKYVPYSVLRLTVTHQKQRDWSEKLFSLLAKRRLLQVRHGTQMSAGFFCKMRKEYSKRYRSWSSKKPPHLEIACDPPGQVTLVDEGPAKAPQKGVKRVSHL